MATILIQKWISQWHIAGLCTKIAAIQGTTFIARRHHKSNFPIQTSNPFCDGISEIIDVRAPGEFKVDHIPGAINLPVLDNTQRAEVGTLYTKDSFNARKKGAQIVTSNISKYLETYFSDKPLSYSPLIYCWRGGQRSKSMAIILSEIGFPVYVLQGGYKSYRSQVISDLEHLPTTFKFCIVTGLTGTGKTYILNKLEEHGEQVLDLECLAKHKGSVLGQYQEEQPTQKYWESLVRKKLSEFDTNKPVWVESESIRVGKLCIPQILFKEMCSSKKFRIHLPMEERVKFIIKDYIYWTKDIDMLKNILGKLRKIHGHAKIDDWIKLAEHNLWEEFVEQLLREHYDPSYTKSQSKNNLTSNVEDIVIPDLSFSSLNNIIAQLTNYRTNVC